MNKIAIMGGEGNMGRRYKCILENVIKKDVVIFDKGSASLQGIKDCDGVIIATPTQNHLAMIKRLQGLNLPILCEKPLTTNLAHLDAFENEHRPICSQVQMVNQYEFLAKPHSYGETHYSYWNSGKDGLDWDCLNIIGLSEKRPEYIDNQSPYWQCMINGYKISIENMDLAYVAMLRRWVNEPKSNWAYASKAHLKVAKYITGMW